MEDAKQAFLRNFGEDYGYPNAPKNIDEIRASEFKRLKGLVYLDHAGATLYSEAQMEAVAKDLTSNVYGNPHSQSDSSMVTSEMIRSAREQVLAFCNASLQEYSCIFTSGATAALKLVGESFPWSTNSCYMYTLENHNSVLGIREYALEKDAGVVVVDTEKLEEKTDSSGTSMFSIDISSLTEHRRTRRKSSGECLNGDAFSLFAFPSECNFSGMKLPLELMNLVKKDTDCILPGKGTWMVLIDAAKGCATQQVDLRKFPADFVVLSFYKMFGYPTGLGALVVRNDAAKLLRKTYFSGGTVSATIADIDFVIRRNSVEQLFEDGTASFLSIASICHGFKIINTLTMYAISRHTQSLADYLMNAFLDLRHANGVHLFELYGCGSRTSNKVKFCSWGPTIAFNLRRSDGSFFGYREVEKLASLSGIQLRTGCFCNPGACARYLNLSHSELLSNVEAGHTCWDDHDILNGKPTGAVRISLGYMSTYEDAVTFLRFVEESFLSRDQSCNNIQITPFREAMHFMRAPRLTSITVFPIKSCGGFTVDHWPLCDSGLLYDRDWLLKSPTGEVLTQKKVLQMSSIHASIDLIGEELSVVSPLCKDRLQISLQPHSTERSSEKLDLFGERFDVEVYSNNVNLWFTKAIGRPCILVRNSGTRSTNCMRKDSRVICRDRKSRLNFVNEAQLLMISADSVMDLNHRLKSDGDTSKCESRNSVYIDPLRFRPNLIISGAEAYAEDRWRKLYIGKAKFSSLGGCNRCQMINHDPCNDGTQRSKEPLATLASFRRVQGKILFGILLRYEGRHGKDDEGEGDSSQTWLKVGQEVLPYTEDMLQDEFCTHLKM